MIIQKNSFLYKMNPSKCRDLNDKEMRAFLKGSIVDLWKCGHCITRATFNALRKEVLYNHY